MKDLSEIQGHLATADYLHRSYFHHLLVSEPEVPTSRQARRQKLDVEITQLAHDPSG